MKIYGIHHVQLAMPEGREDDARTFYQKVLGFGEVQKPPSLDAQGGCWFESGSIKVHLGVETQFAPATKAHPAFLVVNLEDITKEAEQAGYEVVGGLPLEGFDRKYIYDPFGNRIELMQPVEIN